MHPEVPKINGCEAVKCAYNMDRNCNAVAITVGGPEENCPLCDTEIDRKEKAGMRGQIGEVGACHKADCEYNSSLQCNAQPGIHVSIHQGHADCATYMRKQQTAAPTQII